MRHAILLCTARYFSGSTDSLDSGDSANFPQVPSESLFSLRRGNPQVMNASLADTGLLQDHTGEYGLSGHGSLSLSVWSGSVALCNTSSVFAGIHVSSYLP